MGQHVDRLAEEGKIYPPELRDNAEALQEAARQGVMLYNGSTALSTFLISRETQPEGGEALFKQLENLKNGLRILALGEMPDEAGYKKLIQVSYSDVFADDRLSKLMLPDAAHMREGAENCRQALANRDDILQDLSTRIDTAEGLMQPERGKTGLQELKNLHDDLQVNLSQISNGVDTSVNGARETAQAAGRE